MRPSPSRRRRAQTVAALASIAIATPLLAGLPASAAPVACDPFGPATVDAAVPTPQEVLGFPLGDPSVESRDVTVAESDGYLQAVSAASPKVVDGVLATSVQGRPLRYAVVGDEDWLRRSQLARIGRDINALRDADTSEARARQIIRRLPAILWVAGNVHGGEESGTDASLRVLYELAARTDCTAEEILDDAIVVILPTQNPDGRELDTRRNAYGFDMNRDWFARTQPETEGKVEKLRELPPQLFIDAHEMGRATYFFPPNADPVYHDIGETPLSWIYELYGPTMQGAFQRFGIPYFNGDVYDLFYMGYGDTVPATGFNAAGMTYEKSSGDPASQRVFEQYVAIWSTLFAAGEKDDELLTEWRAEHVTAYEQGVAGQLEPNQLYWEGAPITNPVPDITVKHYFLRNDDPSKTDEVQRVARRLQRMDVDVYELRRDLVVPDYTAYGRPAQSTTLPRGSLWIPMAQGQKHWIQAMLNEDTYVPFPYFYDVTAFSSPLLENLSGGYSGADLRPLAVRLREQAEPQAPAVEAPSVAVWQVSQTSGFAIESAGWLRWWLDNRVQVDFSDLTATDIAGGGLSAYDVLVVPNGSATTASNALGDAGRAALSAWVEAGGTLVTFGDVSSLTASLGLTSATWEEEASDIPGSLIRAEVDPSSPLAADVGDTVWAMYEYDNVWTAPLSSSPVRWPAAGDPDWFVSGYAEGEEQLYGKTAVVDEASGAGRVVIFGFDPNYRAFTGGTQQLLLNAISGSAPVAAAQTQARSAQALASSAAAADRMVISVRPDAAAAAQALIDESGATADVVRGADVVSFRVDLGGASPDDVAWVKDLADAAAELGERVVAIRLP